MPATSEQEAALKEAAKALAAAKTKTDVEAFWKTYYLKVGHRALGRLLVGQKVEEIAARLGGKAAPA